MTAALVWGLHVSNWLGHQTGRQIWDASPCLDWFTVIVMNTLRECASSEMMLLSEPAGAA